MAPSFVAQLLRSDTSDQRSRLCSRRTWTHRWECTGWSNFVFAISHILMIARVSCSFLKNYLSSRILMIVQRRWKFTEVDRPRPPHGQPAGGNPWRPQGRLHTRRHRAFVCGLLAAISKRRNVFLCSLLLLGCSFTNSLRYCLLMISSWGDVGDEFIATASAHYRELWNLREWAVGEQLTEKAFISQRRLSSCVLDS